MSEREWVHGDRCPTCGQRVGKWQAQRICGTCHLPIGKGHKWHIVGSTVQHRDCEHPQSYGRKT